MFVGEWSSNRPNQVNNQSELFRSRDWLSANQGPAFAISVGFRSVLEKLVRDPENQNTVDNFQKNYSYNIF